MVYLQDLTVILQNQAVAEQAEAHQPKTGIYVLCSTNCAHKAIIKQSTLPSWALLRLYNNIFFYHHRLYHRQSMYKLLPPCSVVIANTVCGTAGTQGGLSSVKYEKATRAMASWCTSSKFKPLQVLGTTLQSLLASVNHFQLFFFFLVFWASWAYCLHHKLCHHLLLLPSFPPDIPPPPPFTVPLFARSLTHNVGHHWRCLQLLVLANDKERHCRDRCLDYPYLQVQNAKTPTSKSYRLANTECMGRARQGRVGQGRAGQGRAGQGRAGQGRAEQGRAGVGQASRRARQSKCVPVSSRHA